MVYVEEDAYVKADVVADWEYVVYEEVKYEVDVTDGGYGNDLGQQEGFGFYFLSIFSCISLFLKVMKQAVKITGSGRSWPWAILHPPLRPLHNHCGLP